MQGLVVPAYVAGVLGLVMAWVALARPGAQGRWQTWPFAWGLMLVLGAGLVLSHTGLGPPEWIQAEAALRALGAVLLAVALGVALFATRLRRRADALVSMAPQDVDDAVDAVRSQGAPVRGLFDGRLGSDEEVTSPGGLVCAFYEAQVRERAAEGQKGTLLSAEQAASSVIYLRGDRVEAVVPFSLSSTFAPLTVRRCTVMGSLVSGDGRSYADGAVPTQAESHEKTGRMGERCLVIGELRRAGAPGNYEVRGPDGGAPVVIIGQDPMQVGQQLIAKTWRLFGFAAAMVAASSYLLTR